MRITMLFASVAMAALSGCASIVGGSSQVVSVKTMNGAEEVAGANCEMNSNKGTWYVTTPGTVSVHRGYDPINMKCKKDGLEPGIATVKSSTKGMAFGNILLGGIIGAAVDMGTGAAYDYPALITVMMGQTTTIGLPEKGEKKEDALPPSSTPQESEPQQPEPTAAPKIEHIQIGPQAPVGT